MRKISYRFVYNRKKSLNDRGTALVQVEAYLNKKNVRIYVSADNLITWNLDKKFKSYDVELGGVDGLLDGGGTVPLARTFTAGINLTF